MEPRDPIKTQLDAVIPEYYAELRRIANACLSSERPNHTLDPTALVHEAYLRLASQYQIDWPCRAQVLGMAARMMRRILVNYAEARKAQKRDGCLLALDRELDLMEGGQFEISAVDQALARLEELDGRQGRIVELRFFSGLSIEDTALALDTSPATVKREWKSARLWLMRELRGSRP